MLIVYSSPQCKNCEIAKNKIIEDGYDFQEINIKEDSQSRLKLMQNGHAALPVFEVNDKLYSELTEAIKAM